MISPPVPFLAVLRSLANDDFAARPVAQQDDVDSIRHAANLAIAGGQPFRTDNAPFDADDTHIHRPVRRDADTVAEGTDAALAIFHPIHRRRIAGRTDSGTDVDVVVDAPDAVLPVAFRFERLPVAVAPPLILHRQRRGIVAFGHFGGEGKAIAFLDYRAARREADAVARFQLDVVVRGNRRDIVAFQRKSDIGGRRVASHIGHFEGKRMRTAGPSSISVDQRRFAGNGSF